MKKASLVNKRAAVRKGRRLTLRPSNARARQDLGGGFFREVFGPFTIPANGFLTITFRAGTGRVVINAGWTISGLAAAWPTDSFPSSDTTWILILQNPTNAARTVRAFLISKTR